MAANSFRHAPPPEPKRGRFLAISALVAVLASLVFLPGLPGAFVFDDIPNIVNNSTIRLSDFSPAALYELLSTRQVSGAMRGLPTLTFAIDYWRAGGVADPATFKTTNILIHALTTFALVWLFRSLLQVAGTPDRRIAWAAPALALAWAIHPLQVSSVLYAVQRLQTMGTLFLVLALVAYLQARRAQVQGRSGRTGLLLAALSWAFALGCKEDSVLLPTYTLALELTVLRFATASAPLSRLLRRGYGIAVSMAVLAYLFWVVPHYWQSEPHPGRDFNTFERLLTQPRVLCMYLGQILWPLPQHMPFYYDWVQPSRSLLQPWTTLPAIATLSALLALAWWARARQPLFALGVFLFLAAHAITSNVIALELAFEHRNHFALIGAVLAVWSIASWASLHLNAPLVARVLLGAGIPLLLAGATWQRAHDWRSATSLIKAGTEAAPGSARAWVELCDAYFTSGGGVTPSNPNLDLAIDACAAGTHNVPETLNSPALLVALKTLRGDVSAEDWELLQQRLGTVRMSWDNVRAPLILTHYASLGVELDKLQLLRALATLDRRATLSPPTLAYVGMNVMVTLGETELAMPYLTKAVGMTRPNDPLAIKLREELIALGRTDLAATLDLDQSPNESR